MKYRIVTVPHTDPVEYHIQEWVEATRGIFRKRDNSGWVTTGYNIDVFESTFWHASRYPSVAEAEKTIARWCRMAANTGGEIVKEVGC